MTSSLIDKANHSYMRVFFFSMTLFILAILNQPAYGIDDKTQDRIDKLFAKWNKKDAPGAAVVVSERGKVVYRNGFGMANLDFDVPITPQTQFQIASCSKQFTACAIALLAKRGKLSLDDRIVKYLPDLPSCYEAVTIRRLVGHTSGIRDHMELFRLGGWQWPDAFTREQIQNTRSDR